MYAHLYEIVAARAARQPDAIALGGEDGLAWRTLTSAQLLECCEQAARGLAALGVARGDRVITWLPNHWRTPVVLFALWRLGAVVVPFDREVNEEATRLILASVEPRLVLTGHGETPAWAAGTPVVEWWEPDRSSDASSAAPLPAAAPQAGEPNPADQVAAIFFTSGTTGQPKGCTISHANLCSQVEAIRHILPLDSRCRLASILPLSHLFELTVGLLYPLSQGAAIHYVPSRRGPDIVRVLSEQRITHMVAVPQLLTLMGGALDAQLRAALPAGVYKALCALAERLPLAARHWLFSPVHRKIGGQLRTMAAGGAALPADTQRLWERFGVRVMQGYGTSECSPVVACAAADGSTPIGSVGRPLPGVEVRLGADGELLVRGPNVMQGYWRDPARTAEVLVDGWYHTGDLATIDERGNIVLAGRARDLIVLPSGMNVWPQDVEDALRADPRIKDAAVIAVHAPSGGATLHAWLIAADASAQAAGVAEIVASVNGRLAQHQRLATAAWWPEADFPRTNTLKVRRNLLPQPESVGAVRIDVTTAADDPVARVVATVARVQAVSDEQTLASLGLDSLGLTELAAALEERTGKLVSDSALRPELTVAELRSLVAEAPAHDEALAEASTNGTATASEPALWPYTWGRGLRALALPFDLLYRGAVKRTVILGREHLADLPPRVILAGTHHSFADMPLVRHALAGSPARRLAGRLVIAAAAGGFRDAGWLGNYAIAAFGLYPLQQHGEREASLRGLARLAGAGNPILIFPQGHHADPADERSNDPAADFRPGVAHLAASLDAVVVPFGLAGTERLIPPRVPDDFRGKVIAGIPVAVTPGPLAIAFGAPLTRAPGESAAAFTARLQAASFALTREAEQTLAPQQAIAANT